MSNNKKENNLTFEKNQLNESTSDVKAVYTGELKNIKQDILYFKNDILKDMRILEEKVNLKLTEQNMMNTEQFDAYEEKLEQLSDQISIINSLSVNNSNMIEKFKNYEIFKSRIEDKIINLNVKMSSIQKEYKTLFNNNEQLINDNLKYPGIIGKNSKFKNFRNFIDHILKNFQEFNDFKNDIKNLNFNSFKKKVNTSLVDFRNAITESNRNSLTLIQNNSKEFDSKFQKMVKQNDSIMEENEKKLRELKTIMDDYISDFQTKLANLDKNINDKFIEKINEIEKIKNKMKEDMDYIKANLELSKSISQLKNETSEQKFTLKENISENHNYNYNTINNEKTILNVNEELHNQNQNLTNNKEFHNQNQNFQNNNNFQKISSKGLNNLIIKEILLKKHINNKNETSQDENIKIIKNYQNEEEKNNTEINFMEKFSNKMINKSQGILESKSFENNFIDENSDIKNSKDRFSLTQREIHNKNVKTDIFNSTLKQGVDKTNFGRYMDFNQKDFSKNQYSVANIHPNIKIKKVVLPDFLTKRNKNLAKSNSSLTVDYPIQKEKIKKCLSGKDRMNEGAIIKKNIFDVARMNKHKDKAKFKNIVESSKTINKRNKNQINENLTSLMIMKIKPKINPARSLDNLNIQKKRNWSFDKKKDEKIQIGTGQTYKEKIKVRELILINTKNLKKNRKIKL